ncbi:hypothetical protein M9H77_01940 [Catharanthus roseus]|uniref:Uncharacterized protein n=1 Tax=Catharanthus roseus TaxID=4058 RepID=A0ACC0C7G5_CATRO|nr:hypothetical protein M9H77_01940 [Catharanthus roseus]
MLQYLLFFSFLNFFLSGIHGITFTIHNHCPYTIWPATLTSRGTPAITGLELPSQATTTLDVSPDWSGRIWARFVCSNTGTGFSCKSGDCTTGQILCNGLGGVPPTTLIEFTLSGDGNQDFYDISLVDGFNLPVLVTPQSYNCTTISCPVDINNLFCPPELSIYNTDGGVIGCKSACLAFNQPQYCCTGAFGSPDTCKPTLYSQIFKEHCPQAYTYAYDDKTSLVTCPSGGGYDVTFCP